MKKVLLIVVFLLGLSISVYAEKFETVIPCPIPDVETWRKADEERIIYNYDYKSGLVARWYTGPGSEKVNGVTVSVFYKDGTEHLFRKYWAGKTGPSKVGDFLTSKQWLCNAMESPSLPQKGFLQQELEDVYHAFPPPLEDRKIELIDDGVVTGVDEDGAPIISEEYKAIIIFNKDSANNLK